ncbi:hypothetical protein BVU76_22450 [Mycolicibacterium porcinum]|nr:hypothetical protein BVU76_22450 [Mycolicibacterium porcinum]
MRFMLTMAALTAAAITLTGCAGHEPAPPPPAPSSTQPANDTPVAWADKTAPIISNLGDDLGLLGHLFNTTRDRNLLHTACRHIHYDTTRLRNRLPAPDDQITHHSAIATDQFKQLTDQCLAANTVTKTLADQLTATADVGVTEARAAIDRARSLK